MDEKPNEVKPGKSEAPAAPPRRVTDEELKLVTDEFQPGGHSDNSVVMAIVEELRALRKLADEPKPWSTLDCIAWDVYRAWAASGAAAYFERPWRGIWTDVGHPCNNSTAMAIACRIVGAWNPGLGYGGVAYERGGRFVIISQAGLVPCPCGGRQITDYPCRRCSDIGQALPNHDRNEREFGNSLMEPRLKDAADMAAFVALGGTDRKIHVRGADFDGPVRCAKYRRYMVSTVDHARGPWGPGGTGWPDVCRECHRVEFELAEALP